MNIIGSIRRAQLAAIIAAMILARPDWEEPLKALALAVGLIEK